MVTTTPRFFRASQGQTYVSAARFLCFNESCFEREYLLNTRLMWVLICVSRSNHFEKKYFGKGRAVWVPADSCVSRKVSEEENMLRSDLCQYRSMRVFQRRLFEKKDKNTEFMWVPPNLCVSKKVILKGNILVKARPCECRPISVWQRYFERGYVLGRTYVNAARFLCVKGGYFEKDICWKTGLMLKTRLFFAARVLCLKEGWFETDICLGKLCFSH